MNSVFSEQILADKLSKLNSTQQCIETLSHWCIFHRSKADVVVSTWSNQFHSSQMEQKVPLLYLANDILQNSKRKGNEFVTEFWKVLPSALKDVTEKGNDKGKNVVSRLVKIWEERRVFGSRAKNLNNIMLGHEQPPPLEFSKKRSRSVKIVRRDSRSIRTKLVIGGSAEKIVSAFHVVVSEHPTEDSEMSTCKSAVNHVRKMEQVVDIACTQAKDPKRKSLARELEEEETTLKQCIEKLKSVEANRLALVTQLQETLHEQESELENVRTQMQVAQAQIEEASEMKKRLLDENYTAPLRPSVSTLASTDTDANGAQKPRKTAADIAAEVADKLTASSSSQLIMSSVLSTFAAEQAKNAGLLKTSSVSNSYTSAPPNPPLSSIPNPPVSGPNAFVPAGLLPAPPGPNRHLATQASMLSPSPPPSSQAQYQLLPNMSQQYIQTSAGLATAYGYGNLPPVPPVPPMPPPVSHFGAMVPLAQPPPQMTQPPVPMAQQPVHMMQPPLVPPSFRPLPPPGMAFFAQPHHSQ